MSRERQSCITRHRGRVGLQPPERGWGIHCDHLQHTPGQLQVVPDHHEPWWHHGVLHLQYGRQLAGTAEITRILQVKPPTVSERVISFKEKRWCRAVLGQFFIIHPFYFCMRPKIGFALKTLNNYMYVPGSPTQIMPIYLDRLDILD